MYTAISRRDYGPVELLVNSFDIINNHDSCFMSALCKAMTDDRDVKMIELLFKNGADTNLFTQNCYHMSMAVALENADLQVIELFIKYGFDVNQTFEISYGSEPISIWQFVLLMSQSDIKYNKVLELLKRHGAEEKTFTKEQINALYLILASSKSDLKNLMYLTFESPPKRSKHSKIVSEINRNCGAMTYLGELFDNGINNTNSKSE